MLEKIVKGRRVMVDQTVALEQFQGSINFTSTWSAVKAELLRKGMTPELTPRHREVFSCIQAMHTRLSRQSHRPQRLVQQYFLEISQSCSCHNWEVRLELQQRAPMIIRAMLHNQHRLVEKLDLSIFDGPAPQAFIRQLSAFQPKAGIFSRPTTRVV